MKRMQERLAAATELAADAMFQLSTAGQELFHTNMLYWLAVNRADASRPVWDRFGAGSLAGARVAREWQHLDLVIEGARHRLVVENKIHALATAAQLVGYHDKVGGLRGFTATPTSWRLLTLLDPRFGLPAPWEAIRYADLVDPLEQTASAVRGDEQALVRGYARLVRRLVEVVQSYDPADDQAGKVGLEPDEERALREARLFPLVAKSRASRAAQLIGDRLGALLAGPVADVEANLTRGQPLNSWFTPAPSQRRFGWQVQGEQFRLAVVMGKRDPSTWERRKQLAQTQHGDYFDFTLPARLQGLLRPYRGRKSADELLGYRPDFVYRYQRLPPDITWAQLLDLTAWFSKRARHYVEGQR